MPAITPYAPICPGAQWGTTGKLVTQGRQQATQLLRCTPRDAAFGAISFFKLIRYFFYFFFFRGILCRVEQGAARPTIRWSIYAPVPVEQDAVGVG